MEQYKEKVKEFLKPHLHNRELADDTDIFSLGVINSLFAMQLVMFIQEEFEITIEGQDLEFEYFKSINSISEFIDRKVKAA
ncbi:MAG: phosphopantetheine-binding [Eubacterium sp.]|jgi:acyl carrier protein|nr:phosphopantetheine-binding [Eubacterium sp.]